LQIHPVWTLVIYKGSFAHPFVKIITAWTKDSSWQSVKQVA